MAINTKHPDYSRFLADWQKMTDSYDGEQAIKDRGTIYLPATAGQRADGQEQGTATEGGKAYEAYRTRAVYHDFVKDAVETAVGVMHSKDAVIELPDAMEFLRDSATVNGESLLQLLRRINEAQLVNGRFGMLLDLPTTPTDTLPLYIATYTAQNIINWDNGRREEITGQNLNLVVLDETEFERDSGTFEWTREEKYRVLILGDPIANEGAGTGTTYMFGLFDETVSELTPAVLRPASIRGNTLNQIPFVFVNSTDVLPTPDKPPLLGLANLALAIYRGEADYRQSLFMQGQDTLITKGLGQAGQDNLRTGAGAAIHLPENGDASFIGVDSEGLSEQREALQNDKSAARQKGGQLLDATSRNRESGEALRIRTAAQTATLNQLALSGAGALQALLRIGATWMGLDPETVTVKPNLDFAEDELIGTEFKTLMEAKAMGLPLSLQSIHATLQDRGLTEMEFEDELAAIEQEDIPPAGTDEGDNPDDTGNEDEGDATGE